MIGECSHSRIYENGLGRRYCDNGQGFKGGGGGALGIDGAWDGTMHGWQHDA